MSVKIDIPREAIAAFFAIQRQLSAILGRKVDMHTAKGLSPYFRQEVLDEAEVLYVAA